MRKAKEQKPKKEAKPTSQESDEFARFENLTKNLMAVSNVEVREIMAEEKRQKKSGSKRKE